jgi:hypothetical protein
MHEIKAPAGNGRTNDSRKKNSGCGIILILILLILIIFLWPFIRTISMHWTGSIQNPVIPSSVHSQNETPVSDRTAVLLNPGREDLQERNTSTVYNTEYLRWAGKLKPGASAVWGRITIESPEIPVNRDLSPLARNRIYGNLREVNGTGIDLMVFNEANYNAWRNDGTKVSAIINNENIIDYDYSFSIDTGAYYIVAHNSSQDMEAYIGFTGVHVYERNLTSGESPNQNPNAIRCFWDYKKEKLTLFQYIMKLIKPAYNVPVTPPSIF